MKVRATRTLKNSSVGIISKGTIFEGTEETLPEFVLIELEKKKDTFEILVDGKLAKKKRGPKLKDKSSKGELIKQEKKASAIREKLRDSE